MEFLEQNYRKIMDINSQISGTHPIIPERAEIWINSQLTDNRKRLCRLLIENTIYITFQDTIDYIKESIEKTFLKLTNKAKLYFYVGNGKTKSNYFVTIIAIYHLIETYNIEAEFVYDFRNDIEEIIIVDDMTYSGQQIALTIQDFYVYRKINSIPLPNIFISVVGCTYKAANRIRNNYLTRKNLKLLKLKSGKVQIDLELNYGFLISDLKDILGDEDYVSILYYFSPFSGVNPPVSIYFDHKIADEISTFFRALVYGPIIPLKLDYPIQDNFYNCVENVDKSIVKYIEKKLREEEKDSIHRLVFYPFIQGFEIFNPDDFIGEKYYHFVGSQDLFIEAKENNDEEFLKYETKCFSLYSQTNLLCWYKNDPLL